MNTKEEITVDITPDGEVKIEVNGVVGSGCAALTKALEDSLGVTTSDEKKTEYNRREVQHARSENRA